MPFAENDEHFDLNYMLDRNIHNSSIILAQRHSMPSEDMDIFDNSGVASLPMTVGTIKHEPDDLPKRKAAFMRHTESEIAW